MKTGFIGMGTMGLPMALNLIRSGFDVVVHNRTRERELPAVEKGASRADSPRLAAKEAGIVITCLSDTPDVEEVLLGENGVVEGAAPGTLVADMSTIDPGITVKMAETLAQKGIHMLDAPVSGGSEGAEKGALSIMVGGEAADLETIRPVFEAMGKTITHIGPIGTGQLTKAINQVVIAGTYWGVAEGMALGLKAGLDMNKVVQALSGGAAGSWAMDNRSQNMIQNSYPLGFKLTLHRKDIKIALAAAGETGVTLPVTAFVEQMESGLIQKGHGEEDVSVIARCVRELSGIK